MGVETASFPRGMKEMGKWTLDFPNFEGVLQGTKAVHAGISGVALTFGYVNALQVGPLSTVISQVITGEIMDAECELDVLALLRGENSTTPWSGIMNMDVMCFG